MDIDRESTTDNFSSDQSRKQFNEYYGAAKNNYQNITGMQPQMLEGIKGLNDSISQYQKRGGGDTSYFKQAWGQAQGINQDNMNKLNTQSFDPNDNSAWVKAMDDIDNNARLGWGKYNNQLMQNMIGTNMANGSGHQTAAAKQSMMLNSQLASDRANRWQQQYNQNVQDSMKANGQLENFYSTLSNLGIDYAKLSQQDLSTLLNAYQTQSNLYNTMFNAQNSALQPWGQAVALDSSPKQTSHEHKEGTETKTGSSENQGGFWDTAGNVASTAGTIMAMGSCFTGDTLVLTPNGNVEIKDIKVGDEVYSFDSKDKTLKVAKVTEVLDPQERDITDVYVLDKLVSTTSSQPFLDYTVRFVNVEDMVEGETTLVPYGTVSKLVQRDKKEKVYDIKISTGDCYFANGFVVKAAENEW